MNAFIITSWTITAICIPFIVKNVAAMRWYNEQTRLWTAALYSDESYRRATSREANKPWYVR